MAGELGRRKGGSGECWVLALPRHCVSRMSADWRPVPVQPAVPRSPPCFPAQAQAGDSKYAHLSDHARETLESLDRQLTHRDRFVNPPKRGS